jgi:AraC family transcriptional regulator of arabinose operon
VVWKDNAVDPSITLLKGYTKQRSNYRIVRKGGTPNWLLIFTVSGAGRVGSDNGDITANPGQIIFISPGVDHDYGITPTAECWEQLWFHWVPNAAYDNLLRRIIGRSKVKVIQAPESLESEALLREAVNSDTGPIGTLLAMNRLEFFLLQLSREILSENSADRVGLALEYISSHYAKALSVDQLARSLGLSTSRLNGLFRTELGITPRQAIERERMVQAKLLLKLSSRTIQSISDELGFSSPFYFTLRFRKETGMSPTEFRRKA